MDVFAQNFVSPRKFNLQVLVITVTSWRLNSLANRLFVQQFIEAMIAPSKLCVIDLLWQRSKMLVNCGVISLAIWIMTDQRISTQLSVKSSNPRNWPFFIFWIGWHFLWMLSTLKFILKHDESVFLIEIWWMLRAIHAFFDLKPPTNHVNSKLFNKSQLCVPRTINGHLNDAMCCNSEQRRWNLTSRLVMAWWRKELGHHQWRYWPECRSPLNCCTSRVKVCFNILVWLNIIALIYDGRVFWMLNSDSCGWTFNGWVVDSSRGGSRTPTVD